METLDIDKLLQSLQSDNSSGRCHAARALGKCGDKRVIVPLTKALSDSASSVRSSAAIALGIIGNKDAVGPIVSTLDDSDWIVREAAAYALSQIAKFHSPESLAIEGGSTYAETIRWARQAIYGRGIGWPKSIIDGHRLIDRFTELMNGKDRSKIVCATDFDVFRELDTMELLVAATRHEDEIVRRSARFLLNQKYPKWSDTPEARSQMPAFAARIERVWFDLELAEVLCELKDPSVSQIILRCLRSNRDRSFRGQAAQLLRYRYLHEDARVTPALTETLSSDKDHEVRAYAATSLAETAGELATNALITALSSDTHEEVRMRAASALGTMLSERAVAALTNALSSDGSANVRAEAAKHLGNSDFEQASAALSGALRDPDSRVVTVAVHSLLRRNDQWALEPLMARFNADNWTIDELHPDPWIHIAEVIAASGDERGILALIRMAERLRAGSYWDGANVSSRFISPRIGHAVL